LKLQIVLTPVFLLVDTETISCNLLFLKALLNRTSMLSVSIWLAWTITNLWKST